MPHPLETRGQPWQVAAALAYEGGVRPAACDPRQAHHYDSCAICRPSAMQRWCVQGRHAAEPQADAHAEARGESLSSTHSLQRRQTVRALQRRAKRAVSSFA